MIFGVMPIDVSMIESVIIDPENLCSKIGAKSWEYPGFKELWSYLFVESEPSLPSQPLLPIAIVAQSGHIAK